MAASCGAVPVPADHSLPAASSPASGLDAPGCFVSLGDPRPISGVRGSCGVRIPLCVWVRKRCLRWMMMEYSLWMKVGTRPTLRIRVLSSGPAPRLMRVRFPPADSRLIRWVRLSSRG